MLSYPIPIPYYSSSALPAPPSSPSPTHLLSGKWARACWAGPWSPSNSPSAGGKFKSGEVWDGAEKLLVSLDKKSIKNKTFQKLTCLLKEDLCESKTSFWVGGRQIQLVSKDEQVERQIFRGLWLTNRGTGCTSIPLVKQNINMHDLTLTDVFSYSFYWNKNYWYYDAIGYQHKWKISDKKNNRISTCSRGGGYGVIPSDYALYHFFRRMIVKTRCCPKRNDFNAIFEVCRPKNRSRMSAVYLLPYGKK